MTDKTAKDAGVKSINGPLFALSVAALLAVAVYASVRWLPFGEYPGEPFFDLAAQTIPILLVALAVEAQARRFDTEAVGKRVRIAAVVLLAGGEIAAVAVSASLYVPDRDSAAMDLLVVTTALGLLGGFLAVIAVALRTPALHPTEPAKSAEPTGTATATDISQQIESERGTARRRLVPSAMLGAATIGAALILRERRR